MQLLRFAKLISSIHFCFHDGSVEMKLLHAAIKHITIHIKNIVGDETIVLTRDERACLNGFAWIDEFKLNNFYAFIALANTSHFFNPVMRL